LLACSLVLAQSVALLHAQDHATAPNSNICDSCLTTHNNDSAVAVELTPLVCASGASDGLQILDHSVHPKRTIQPYLTRAPPIGLFIPLN
jgi:hypothetical protein